MKVYLNALSAIQFDRRIARAVILHALPVETSLMKVRAGVVLELYVLHCTQHVVYSSIAFF